MLLIAIGNSTITGTASMPALVENAFKVYIETQTAMVDFIDSEGNTFTVIEE